MKTNFRFAISFIIALIISLSATAQHYGTPYGFASYPAYGVTELTGGAGGEVVIINGQADAKKFQDALDDDNEPRIIYLIGTVTLPEYTDVAESPVSTLAHRMTKVKSNKTIIGVGTDAMITGCGLSIYSGSGEGVDYTAETTVKNVIIQNIEFNNGLDDEINIQGGSHHIWIDHCFFHTGSDGLLDFKRASDFLTVSYCHFTDHGKMSLVGHSAASDIEAMDMGHLRVTYDHCYWDDLGERGSRHPRIRHGIVHQTNAYFLGASKNSAIDGIVCNEWGRLTVEGCYFQWAKWATQVAYGDSNPGEVKEQNNLMFECKAELDAIWYGKVDWNTPFTDLSSTYSGYPSADPHDYYDITIQDPEVSKTTCLAESGNTLDIQMGDFSLTILTTGSGTVAISPEKGMYDDGDEITITPTAGTYYTFGNWSGDASGSTTPYVFTITKNTTITANFTTDKKILTLSAVTNGSLSVSPEKAMYDDNEQVTITATPNAYCEFTGWTGDASGTTNPLIITMNGSKTVGANFISNKCTVTLSSSDFGSATLSPSQEFYLIGDNVTINATPDANCNFSGWSGSYTGTELTKVITLEGDMTILASFTQQPQASITLQAYEACDYSANNETLIFTNHTGYSGDGFIDLENTSGSLVEFKIDAAAGQSATLEITYSNGATTRNMDLYVNNTLVKSDVAFAGLTDWNTWSTVTEQVTLTQGTNTIKLLNTDGTGGPNFDKFDLDASTISIASCSSAEIATSVENKEIVNNTISVTPNPMSSESTIRFVVENAGMVEVNSYSLNGVKTTLSPSQFTTTGINEISISKIDFDSGVYFIEVIVNNNRSIQKLVVQ